MYLLCKTLCENGVADANGSDLFVVFISNEKKQASILSLVVPFMFGLCLVFLIALFQYNLCVGSTLASES